MRPLAVALTSTVAVAVALLATGIAVGVFTPVSPVGGTEILYLSGEVVHVVTGGPSPMIRGLLGWPPAVVSFTVPASGARLVGSVRWDHSSALFLYGPAAAFWGCPNEFSAPSYSGPAYDQSWNQTLTPGPYEFGAICAGWANATVTSTVEVVPLPL
jgi:hypothetical protein